MAKYIAIKDQSNSTAWAVWVEANLPEARDRNAVKGANTEFYLKCFKQNLRQIQDFKICHRLREICNRNVHDFDR